MKGIYPCIYVLSGTEAAEGGDEPEEPEAKIERITVKEFLEKADTENAYELTGVVKTISTDAAGNFSCKLDVSKGNPEFYYFCRNGRRLASVLVDAGDRIELKADTLGNFSLSGSEEAELYSSVESDYRAFTADMNALVAKLESDSENYAANSKALTARYVQYYRDRIRFVMEHSHSIAVVPVY